MFSFTVEASDILIDLNALENNYGKLEGFKLGPPSADEAPASDNNSQTFTVTAEELSGILRVDSYFAPRHMPRARVALRFVSLELVAHNELPSQSRPVKPLEGYYVSKPLMRSHRVLTLSMRDTAAQAILGESSRLLFDTYISSDILNSSTGSMEQLIEEFRMQGTVSLNNEQRLLLRAGDIRAAMHVQGVCTLQALAHDWIDVYKS
ncbi:jg5671, partial [Pararge aegeria aegeria]